MERLAEQAKRKMASGDKRGAIYAMKKRKLQESELAKIENVKMTLETQAIGVEGASQNVETFNAMSMGSSAMASIRKVLGIERIDGLMDDIKEEMDMHREVDIAFTQPIDPCMADDDELLAELNALGGIGGATKASSFSMPFASSRPPAKTPIVQQKTQKETSRFALFA